MEKTFFVTNCRDCHAPIEFITTAGGKKIPVELKKIRLYPPPKGQIGETVGINERGEYKRGTTTPQPGRGFEVVQEAHFAYCPMAKLFRTRRRPEPGRATRLPKEMVRLPPGKMRHTQAEKRAPEFEQISMFRRNGF